MPEDSGCSLLGRCPCCDEHIPADRLLAEVKFSFTEARRTRVFAECPGCHGVVRPL